MYTSALIQYRASPTIFTKPYSLHISITYYYYHLAALYLLSHPDSVRPTYYRESNPLTPPVTKPVLTITVINSANVSEFKTPYVINM